MAFPKVEKVVLGTTSINDPQFKEDGKSMSFFLATRMVFTFCGAGVVVDSDLEPALIDWTIGDGVVRTMFGGVAIPAGEYPTEVKVYDPAHTDGQVLSHSSGPKLMYNFVDGC